jgi:hypothetical protein
MDEFDTQVRNIEITPAENGYVIVLTEVEVDIEDPTYEIPEQKIYIAPVYKEAIGLVKNLI